MLVEIIACSLADAVVAREAGAGRVELCLAMQVGGLTPYLQTIASMSSVDPFPVAVMVRPQPGGFVGQSEFILRQIDEILGLGFSNLQIVTGCLTSKNELDLTAMKAIRKATEGMQLSCHRCFDLTPDPFVALKQLVDLGFDRLLTSGQAPNAQLGLSIIANLVEEADGRIEVVAGVGIRPHNVKEIITMTGVNQVHASCFEDAPPSSGGVDFGPTQKVSAMKVKALVSAAKQLDR